MTRGEIQTRNGNEERIARATKNGKYFERKNTEHTKMRDGQTDP